MPLRVCANPCYFTDSSGKAIYLTGSHTWNNFYDQSDASPPEFDYAAYLSFLRSKNHNFIRLWMMEQAAWAPWTAEKMRFHPLIYVRPGPGTALDGEPKFDLKQFNQEYFDRLRLRVSAARDKGIYVAVMLFNGWSVGKQPNYPGNPWPGHPFHRENNVNGIDGDLNGDGEGREIHTLRCPAITALQESYVSKVVDTLNDLDNVLWEISNESHPLSKDWQYHMINYIKRYEAGKRKQHPVGMTATQPAGSNVDLFESPADWISPDSGDYDIYRENPPAANGHKVIIADTDHLWGVGGDRSWVWKSFIRGLNPIFMDPFNDPRWKPSELTFELCRRAMGHTRSYASRMNLAAMTPRNELASSGYCLANSGNEYLVYLPFDACRLESARFFRSLKHQIRSFRRLFRLKVMVDISAGLGEFLVEWFQPSSGDIVAEKPVTGGTKHFFTAPFRGDAVLYIRKESRNYEEGVRRDLRGPAAVNASILSAV
jgi:hypothetical protein